MLRNSLQKIVNLSNLIKYSQAQQFIKCFSSAAAAQSCPSSSSGKQQASQNQQQQKPLPNPDIKIKHKFLVLSGKGGVGKSTISSQLALNLSQLGIQTGILDIDICGPNIPRMLGIENEKVYQNEKGLIPVQVNKNLKAMSMGLLLNTKNDAVVWRGPRKHQMIIQFLQQVQWGELDCLVIDTPPGTSDEHISIVESVSSSKSEDGAIIVTTPQEVALLDVRKEISFCQRSFINIVGVVENMSGFVCPNCKHQSHIFPANTGGGEALCKEFNLKMLAKIPLDPSVLQSTEEGQNVKSASSIEFQKITQHLINEFSGLKERMKVIY